MRGLAVLFLAVICCALVSACANADLVAPDAMEVPADAADDAVDPTDAPDALAPDACVMATEVCNGADDDCDGAMDEEFGIGALCDGPDLDQCREGMMMCAPLGGGTVCGDVTGDAVETCNGADDDCDTMMDEGLGLGGSCDGADTDACSEGTMMCAADGTAVCSDATTSTVETCNGADDDCRGGADDGFAVGADCAVGVGQCRRTGQNVCNPAGTGVTCDAAAGSATAEVCGDGVDQDCNGADVSCPINDAAAGAVDISAAGTFTVDLSAARDDDSNAGVSCGGTGGRDVFYRFTLPAAEAVYFDTFGSSFNSVLRIYSGACPTRGGTPSCDDDAGACAGVQSQLAAQLAAGSYCLVVDQSSSADTTGALVLHYTRGGRAGTPIVAGSGSQTGTTCGAVDRSDGSCRVNTAPDQGYFFTMCPSETRTVGANTCAGTTWDSVVYLHAAGSGTDLACSDDAAGCGSGLQSSFTGASVTGPGLFWLVVDGYQSACGAYTLTYTM